MKVLSKSRELAKTLRAARQHGVNELTKSIGTNQRPLDSKQRAALASVSASVAQAAGCRYFVDIARELGATGLAIRFSTISS